MIRKLLRMTVWLLTIAGLIGAVVTGRERARLEREWTRLAEIVGDLPVEDPAMPAFRAIETGRPLEFTWRAYYPPGYHHKLVDGSGSSSGSSSQPAEFLGYVRFRENRQGLLEVHRQFHGGASRTTLGDAALAKLLRGRWKDIRVEQIGTREIVQIADKNPVTLLKLTIPPDLAEQARPLLAPYSRNLPADSKDRDVILYQLTLSEPDPEP